MDAHCSADNVQYCRGNVKIVESIVGWFDSWQEWQRNLFLSSILNSFSTRQLRGLESSIEALFHKDFLIQDAQNNNGNLCTSSKLMSLRSLTIEDDNNDQLIKHIRYLIDIQMF